MSLVEKQGVRVDEINLRLAVCIGDSGQIRIVEVHQQLINWWLALSW